MREMTYKWFLKGSITNYSRTDQGEVILRNLRKEIKVKIYCVMDVNIG